MATIYQIPEPYRATAERLPAELLKSSSPADVVSRVIAHDRAFAQACAMPTAVAAAPFFAYASEFLHGDREPPAEDIATATKAVAPAPRTWTRPAPTINRSVPSTGVDNMLYKGGAR